MDQAHIHLLITHLAILGSLLGGFVLVHGLWTRSPQTKIAAYNLLVLSAIGGSIAYFTGEGAEETVENIPGIAENLIEQHEESAIYALVSLIILGIAALVGLLLTLNKSSLTRTAAIAVLFLSLISFGFAARTGYLGGQIRHTEINSASAPAQQQNGETGHEQDDD
jgi:uncharacterized membrane protein